MGDYTDQILVLIVLLDFFALGASRMRAVIRAAALQGFLLGVLPLILHEQLSLRVVLICVGTMVIKGLVMPAMLLRAIREVTIRREVDPLVGFTTSLFLGAVGTGLALLFSSSLPLLPVHAAAHLVPASFATVFTGFLVLTTRQKAVVQVVGYMILENGIFLFGLLLLEALPFLVELGVLLDLLVGVFVMGIILHRIQRTFSAIDTAHLSALRD
ncbi:MAG TPA: hydrogenase [Planctomycetota bacterium]|nr:hydrogenase [Planctomycetota bacterium]